MRRQAVSLVRLLNQVPVHCTTHGVLQTAAGDLPDLMFYRLLAQLEAHVASGATVLWTV